MQKGTRGNRHRPAVTPGEADGLFESMLLTESHVDSTPVYWIDESTPITPNSLFIVAEPARVPGNVDTWVLEVFAHIEQAIPDGYRIVKHSIRFVGIDQYYTVMDPDTRFWTPEGLAAVAVAVLLGLWIFFSSVVPPSDGTKGLYKLIGDFLFSTLGSAAFALMAVVCAWLWRLRQAKYGRKVVYRDGK